jgi:hypothetical protein
MSLASLLGVKATHDLNIDPHSSFASQHAGKHRYPLVRKRRTVGGAGHPNRNLISRFAISSWGRSIEASAYEIPLGLAGT